MTDSNVNAINPYGQNYRTSSAIPPSSITEAQGERIIDLLKNIEALLIAFNARQSP